MSEPSEPEARDRTIDAALAFLHAHLTGVLRFDGEHRPLKVAVAHDGKLIASVMVAMARALDTTLCLPDEDDTSMHLQVTLEEFTEAGPKAELADRWRIYHGDPPDVRWAELSIDAGRFDGFFIDGDALMVPNSLASTEGAICRTLNASHTGLVREACLRHAQVGIESPVVVGVDQFGIDVRGAFDVVRLAADTDLRTEADVLSLVRRLAI